ncbi:MAG: helix-turn-helix domain-containing protein [Labilithrix sp.]|nr:helix-turn-helix domain-containing protein [Labilithrix sp.]
MSGNVGELLRHWRTSRGKSQLDLSVDAEVSTRHISFIENGKASPSREMLLVLASALDVPLRERNTLLLSAGFAPVYRETKLDAPEMAHVRAAIDCIMTQTEPNGAVLLDREWRALRMNKAITRIIEAFVVDPTSALDLEGNLVLACFDRRALRDSLVNFDDVAASIITRLQREASAEGSDGPSRKLLAKVMAYDGLPKKVFRSDPSAQLSLMIPVHLRRGDLEVRFFTTLTTLGTPLDVTLDELRIESYYAADDATARWLRS